MQKFRSREGFLNRISSGTTIIEFLIYFLLLMFLVIASGRVGMMLWQSTLSFGKKRASFISLLAAHDHFIRDVKKTWYKTNCWQQVGDSQCSFILPDNQLITWKIKNGVLVRQIKTYSSKSKKWKAKNSQVMVPHILKASFEMSQDRRGLQLVLHAENYMIENLISFPGKVLDWQEEQDRQ